MASGKKRRRPHGSDHKRSMTVIAVLVLLICGGLWIRIIGLHHQKAENQTQIAQLQSEI